MQDSSYATWAVNKDRCGEKRSNSNISITDFLFSSHDLTINKRASARSVYKSDGNSWLPTCWLMGITVILKNTFIPKPMSELLGII